MLQYLVYYGKSLFFKIHIAKFGVLWKITLSQDTCCNSWCFMDNHIFSNTCRKILGTMDNRAFSRYILQYLWSGHHAFSRYMLQWLVYYVKSCFLNIYVAIFWVLETLTLSHDTCYNIWCILNKYVFTRYICNSWCIMDHQAF